MTDRESAFIILFGLVAAWIISYQFGTIDGLRLRPPPPPIPVEDIAAHAFKGGFID